MQAAAAETGAAHRRTRPAAASGRDHWLLMRLLAAGQSAPRLADRLIAERGSLGAVLQASDERLRQLGADANGIAMLGLLREAVRAVLERDPAEAPRIGNAADILDTLHADMAWLAVEEVRCVFLDSGRRLIRTETMGRGTVAAAPLYPREIARRALELSASAIILAHNHPSGDPTPSASDFEMTRRVGRALAAIEVVLVDHVVIARRGWARAMRPEHMASTAHDPISGSHINRSELHSAAKSGVDRPPQRGGSGVSIRQPGPSSGPRG